MRTFLPSYLILYIDTYNQPLQDSPEHIIIQTRWVSLTFLIKNKNIKLNNWTLWARIAHWSFLLSKDNWQQHEIRVWHRILLWPVRKQAWTPFFFRAVLILWRSDSTRSWKHSPDKTWDAIWILNVQRTSLRSFKICDHHLLLDASTPTRYFPTENIFTHPQGGYGGNASISEQSCNTRSPWSDFSFPFLPLVWISIGCFDLVYMHANTLSCSWGRRLMAQCLVKTYLHTTFTFVWEKNDKVSRNIF